MTAPARRPPAWATLAALWLLVFSVTTQTMILAPILPRVAEQLRISEGRVAYISTGHSVAVALVAVVAGPVSDRVGRRRMLLAGAAAMTVGLALHALALGFGSFLAVRVLTGAGGGVLTGATAAYVGDYFPPERRGWANGWVMSGMAAGQVLGIPVGTLLAARSGFRAPFLVFAATMAVTGAGVSWLRQGAPDVFAAVDALVGARRADGIAGKVMPPGGIVVVTWRLGGTELDTGFRPGSAADADRLVAAVQRLAHAGSAS